MEIFRIKSPKTSETVRPYEKSASVKHYYVSALILDSLGAVLPHPQLGIISLAYMYLYVNDLFHFFEYVDNYGDKLWKSGYSCGYLLIALLLRYFIISILLHVVLITMLSALASAPHLSSVPPWTDFIYL